MKKYLGVVLDINGKTIALEPSTAIEDIKANGMEIGLPAGTEVRLGAIGGGLEGFIKNFDATYKLPNKNTLPSFLGDGYDALTTAEVTINDLYIKISPENAQNKTTKSYRFGLYVGWAEPKKLVGNLKLKGFSVKLESETKDLVPGGLE